MLKKIRAKKKFCFRRILNNFLIGSVGILSVFTISFAGNYTGANPSLQKIDSDWRALYGSPVHDAIVVFNKMTGGTASDATKDSLCIMRFGMAGSTTATVKNLFRYVQWTGASGWGVSSAYRISPDGSKIALQNGSAVSVCDTNGLNQKIIKSVQLGTDQLALSWDDSASIRRIVYSIGLIIVRTVVNTDNTVGKTDTLWNHAWSKDPSAGNGASVYTSINKVGNYLCFDMPVGINLPVIVNLATQTSKNPSNGGDGCQARLCADNMGTISYHEQTHLTGAAVWRWTSNNKIGTVPCPNGQNSNCSDCGNNMFYWCDSDSNYMVQTGDNQASASPGCYTKAFIRKGKFSSQNMMYLGDFFAFPALWINPKISTQTVYNRVTTSPANRIAVTITATDLTLANPENRTLDNAVLTNVNGVVVAIGRKTAPNVQRFTVSSIPAGIYIVSWRESNSILSRFVTIAH
jgi:filamentous hemagglutinin family protein